MNLKLLKSAFNLPSDLETHFLDFGLTFRDKIVKKTTSRLYIASYVISPFFPFIKDLKQLGTERSSIDIRILIDEKANKDLDFNNMSFAKVKFFNKGTLHMKLIISDGKRCIVGSHNITYSASEENYEIGVYIEGNLCYYLERMFTYLWDEI